MQTTTRRDVLQVAANVFPVAGAAAAVWPFLAQMNPDAQAEALATIEIDLAPIFAGQSVTVLWRGKAVFIRHRTPAEIASARAVGPNELPDPFARNLALVEDSPASDENRTQAGHENWLVLVGVCTHAGCVPGGNRIGELRGDYGGWRCPCHLSLYDTSGRVRRGPAPQNLVVPPYKFVTANKIVVGEKPA